MAVLRFIPIHMLVDMNHSIDINIAQLQTDTIIICCQLVHCIVQIYIGSISLNRIQLGPHR
jgi:hypothetical protein